MSAAMQEKPKKAKKSRAKEPSDSGVQFLTFSNPADWSSRESRLAVRSHVTRRQHQLSRGEVPSIQTVSVPPLEKKVDSESPSRAEVIRFPASSHRKRKSVGRVDTNLPEKRRSLQIDQPIFSPVDERFVLGSHSAGPTRAPSPWIESEPQSATRSTYQSRSNSIVYSENEVGPVPEPTQTSFFALPPNILSDVAAREMLFGSIEEYMLRTFAPLGFSALYLTPEAGRVWLDTLLNLSKLEPALRYARLLFGAGHLRQINLMRPEVEAWLHERTVAETFAALQSEERNLSEGLILATGRLAFYESMFGDRQLAHGFHRPAQLRMITTRGGMEALKLPEAVKYLMRWADNVMSLQSGTGPLLSGDPENNTIQPESAEHTLKALAIWLPEQHAMLMSERQFRDSGVMPQLELVHQIDPLISLP